MNIWKEIGLYCGIGIVLSIVATFPLFQHTDYISNHGDVNRGLIFSGIARQDILEGKLPVWNPYTCGAGPLLADVESWFLQPLFFLTLPFGELVAMKLSYTLTIFGAFVGFAFFGRKILSFGPLAALTFASFMALGGYISQHLAEGYYVWVSSAWIPWALLFGMLSLKNVRYIPLAGLMLAFMLGSGSMHMVVYTMLFLGLVIVLQRSERAMVYRILILVGIATFFTLFASIKLLPALTVITTQESRPGFTLPISFLPQMLLDRGLVPAVEYNGIKYRFGEFGNYIGIGSLMFAGTTLLFLRKGLWKQYHGMFLASLIMLVLVFTTLPITYGYLSRITDLFRIPSRLMIFPLLGLAILASYAIDHIGKKKTGVVIAILFFAVFSVDLATNDYTLFSRMFSLPLPELHREDVFMRVRDAYSTKDERYYRAGYIDFLEHRASNGLCRFYQVQPNASAIDNSSKMKEDRGEIYPLEKGVGKVELLSRDNSFLRFHVTTLEPTFIMVNMNYYPGWNTDMGFPVVNRDGLIAVAVPTGEHTVVLSYLPKSVVWGIAISCGAVLVAGLWTLRMR